ncbi:EGF domain containing protein [Trichuris trichiura]|uniref:EGF domain containing protein n=1 Tax=Trichuris trichiura TaxID=36087 RepID=A0A077YWZ6_TRITR|nr:EGF domain containing protein [Trichuris trichiura]
MRSTHAFLFVVCYVFAINHGTALECPEKWESHGWTTFKYLNDCVSLVAMNEIEKCTREKSETVYETGKNFSIDCIEEYCQDNFPFGYFWTWKPDQLEEKRIVNLTDWKKVLHGRLFLCLQSENILCYTEKPSHSLKVQAPYAGDCPTYFHVFTQSTYNQERRLTRKCTNFHVPIFEGMTIRQYVCHILDKQDDQLYITGVNHCSQLKDDFFTCGHDGAFPCDRNRTFACNFNHDLNHCVSYYYEKAPPDREKYQRCTFDYGSTCNCTCTDDYTQWTSWSSTCKPSTRIRIAPIIQPNDELSPVHCSFENITQCCVQTETNPSSELEECTNYIYGTNISLVKYNCSQPGAPHNCLSKPCMNGGTCSSDGLYYFCDCKPGFKGFQCEQQVKYCENDTCSPNGECQNVTALMTYRCHCRTPYAGRHCEHAHEYCKADSCSGHGACLNLSTGKIKCICYIGFVGQFCGFNLYALIAPFCLCAAFLGGLVLLRSPREPLVGIVHGVSTVLSLSKPKEKQGVYVYGRAGKVPVSEIQHCKAVTSNQKLGYGQEYMIECVDKYCEDTFPVGYFWSWIPDFDEEGRVEQSVPKDVWEKTMYGFAILCTGPNVSCVSLRSNRSIIIQGRHPETYDKCKPLPRRIKTFEYYRRNCSAFRRGFLLDDVDKHYLCLLVILEERSLWFTKANYCIGWNYTLVSCGHEGTYPCERNRTFGCNFNHDLNRCVSYYYTKAAPDREKYQRCTFDYGSTCNCSCSDSYTQWTSWSSTCKPSTRMRIAPIIQPNDELSPVHCSFENKTQCCAQTETNPSSELEECTNYVYGTNISLVNHNCSKPGGRRVVDEKGHFKCQCAEGYEGMFCEKTPHDCLSKPCMNGGTCSSDGLYYLCDCKPGFKGFQCEQQVKYCENDTCSPNGECQNVTALMTYRCHCRTPYAGRHCEHAHEYCKADSCSGHGACLNLSTGKIKCICYIGFVGQFCGFNLYVLIAPICLCSAFLGVYLLLRKSRKGKRKTTTTSRMSSHSLNKHDAKRKSSGKSPLPVTKKPPSHDYELPALPEETKAEKLKK